MDNILIVNKKELENFLYYMQDKISDSYKTETSIAIERFLKSLT